MKCAMMPFSCTLRSSSVVLTRCFSVSASCKGSHYESLGVTPRATQADIKSAYYKMSMEFHPDKNKGSEEAAQKFRSITEAYEVLGNLRLRKLYDRGILHTAGEHFGQSAEETKDKYSESRFYKSREKRSKAPPPTGKTAVYNFDEWTYMHYGTAFSRREAAKARYESKVGRGVRDGNFIVHEAILIGVTFALASLVLSLMKNKSYDVVEDISEGQNDQSYPPDSLPTRE